MSALKPTPALGQGVPGSSDEFTLVRFQPKTTGENLYSSLIRILPWVMATPVSLSIGPLQRRFSLATSLSLNAATYIAAQILMHKVVAEFCIDPELSEGKKYLTDDLKNLRDVLQILAGDDKNHVSRIAKIDLLKKLSVNSKEEIIKCYAKGMESLLPFLLQTLPRIMYERIELKEKVAESDKRIVELAQQLEKAEAKNAELAQELEGAKAVRTQAEQKTKKAIEGLAALQREAELASTMDVIIGEDEAISLKERNRLLEEKCKLLETQVAELKNPGVLTKLLGSK